MVDRITRNQRSRNMSRIRATNTRPELLLRSSLHRVGLRFRLHGSNLPGTPDLVLSRHRAVIFCHGCFWHRHPNCRFAYAPKTRIAFWQEKFRKNRSRDAKQIELLREKGWRVLVVWECSLRGERKRAESLRRAAAWVRTKSKLRQIPAPT